MHYTNQHDPTQNVPLPCRNHPTKNPSPQPHHPYPISKRSSPPSIPLIPPLYPPPPPSLPPDQPPSPSSFLHPSHLTHNPSTHLPLKTPIIIITLIFTTVHKETPPSPPLPRHLPKASLFLLADSVRFSGSRFCIGCRVVEGFEAGWWGACVVFWGRLVVGWVDREGGMDLSSERGGMLCYV